MKDTFKDMELVSVITPVHNAQDFLSQTIESVLNQTYQNFEIILVDDASSDLSRDIIDKYQKIDNRVKSVLLNENLGVANARNEGIKNANGRFIAFLDSDDLWKEDKLEKQINFMIENDYEFTYTGYELMDENGNMLGKVVHTKDRVDYNELLKHNVIGCLSVVIDRSKIQDIQMKKIRNGNMLGKVVHTKDRVDYNELLKHNVIGCLSVVIDRSKIQDIQMKKIRHEDYSAWLKILKRGFVAYGLDENLASYRTRMNSLSGNKIKSAMWTWNIIRKEENTPLPKAVYCFSNYAFVNLKKHLFKYSLCEWRCYNIY